MMKISRKTDYALRATIYLSHHPFTKIHLISEISKATGVSRDFMAKILKDLSIRGLVKAQKGANGGYKLCTPPEEISFRDVIEAIEGPLGINECIPDAGICTRIESCEMYGVWYKAYEAMANVFEKAKISDMAKITDITVKTD